MVLVFDFIKENYRIVIDVITIIIATIIFCLRKKPVKVVDSVQGTVLKLLPGLINDVENNTDLKGADKKLKVLENLEDLLLLLGYSQETIKLSKIFASDQVEVILSTPQKKGE